MRLPVWLRRRTGIFSSGPFVSLRRLLRKLPLLLLKFFVAGLLGVAVAWPGLLVEHLPVASLWAALQDIPVRVWAGAGVALAVLVVSRKIGKPRQPAGLPVLREPRPAAWWIVPAALLIGAAVTVTAWWLLDGMPDRLSPYQLVTARRGAIQTALGAGAGIGAAVTLMLAFRRQRHQEIANLVTAHDATERRVTELYTKAVEQLGSDKAAVRLGGLYALERLAQDNEGHRQTIVNVICAYLRMPYAAPPEPDPARERAQALRDAHRRHRALRATVRAGHASSPAPQADTNVGALDAAGERQVRLTAQRILATHLRDKRTPQQREKGKAADPRFWAGMRIDLTGALLIDLNFRHCHTTDAYLNGVTFTGDAWFGGATFTGDAQFEEATFTGNARFGGVTFTGEAWFEGVTFTGNAWFGGVTFTGDARFGGVTFTREAWFGGVTFTRDARFNEAAVTTPAGNHVWPEGWRVVVQGDGTGRLEWEAEPEPTPESEKRNLPASEAADPEDEKPTPSSAEPDDPAEPAEPDDDLT